MTSDQLAALVGSRICHDLISPIGAIGNGVELLSLTDGDTSAEMALITESVESASARIRFFRIAFGSAAADQSISRNEVMTILSATARGGRFSYMWQPAESQPRHHVRIAFLLLLCFETALPGGGDVNISCDGTDWTLVAQGRRVNMDDDLWGVITGATSAANLTAAQIHFALLKNALADAGRTLTFVTDDNRLTARF